SEETKQLIKRVAQEMGYHPHVIAQSLQRRRTNTVGFIVPATERYLSDPYFLELLAGIGDGAASYDFDLLISTCKPMDPKERLVYERMVKGRRVDGIVVARTRCDDERIAYLVSEGFPLIAFGRTASEQDFPYLDVDGEKGVCEAVEYLIGLGHRRIGFISPSMYLMFAEHRLAGYKRALQDNGLELDPALVVEGNLTQSGGYQRMEQLLDLEEPPTAVVTGNDLMAFGAMETAQERGLVVGHDIAVIGFDDIPLAAYFRPTLTTVRQPIYDIGKMLSQMLIKIIKGEEPAQRQIILQPELVVRESSGVG
ncbi:MAG: LacI family DNA-binding transcriptional regulator, partial [Anaerolineales bacterium]|nr:LacI family DNA-binding transcriptional regulator [Anaerolineales bacterium]